MSLPASYCPNYFSIDDILATQERVPCKFVQDISELGMLESVHLTILLTFIFSGKLDPSNQSNDLKAGSELELPLWLVQPISLSRPPIVETTLPKIYSEYYREILKADPTCIDLNRLCSHFYEIGSYLSRYDPKRELPDTLLNVSNTMHATRIRSK